jgi:hypothetical protein
VILNGSRPGEFKTNDPLATLLSLTKSLIVPHTNANVAGVVAAGEGVSDAVAGATVGVDVGEAVLTGGGPQAATLRPSSVASSDRTRP